MDDEYSLTIKLEILVYFDFESMFDTILNRHFIFNLKQYNFDTIKGSSLEKKFNILFGLLTKEERQDGFNYVNSFYKIIGSHCTR